MFPARFAAAGRAFALCAPARPIAIARGVIPVSAPAVTTIEVISTTTPPVPGRQARVTAAASAAGSGAWHHNPRHEPSTALGRDAPC